MKIDERISKAFRDAFESHPAREADPGVAISSARETASELVPAGVHGSFDDETLTFVADKSDAEKQFIALCEECGSDAVSEETAILSVGREFLPAFALVVFDGGQATDEYWQWLASQTASAQAEHDAEYAAGHEWHRDNA
jgi:hypothetical protein